MLKWSRFGVFAVALTAAPAAAPVRTIMEQAELPMGQAQVAALGTVRLPADAAIDWHVHPGIEMGYVEAGRMRLSIAGAADRTIAAGGSFLIPRGAVHRSSAIGGDARMVVTWITDRGQALSAPASAPQTTGR